MTDSNRGQTVLAPVLGEAHAAGKNIVWCGTLQLVWNRLRPQGGGKPEDLGVELDEVVALAQALNCSKLTEDDVDPVACTMATIDGAAGAQQVEALAPSDAFRSVMEGLSANQLALFAKLHKGVEFPTALSTEDTGNYLQFAGKQVRCFGIWDNSQRKAKSDCVVVHHFASQADFIVELLTKQGDDRLFVARTSPGETLQDTFDMVMNRMRDAWRDGPPPAKAMTDSDMLIIPKIAFELTRGFSEVVNRTVNNGPFAGRVIDGLEQMVDFKLNERGAVLRSEALAVMSWGGSLERATPRHMICNGPFAVLMMRTTARRPYFVTWIDNAAVLESVDGAVSSP